MPTNNISNRLNRINIHTMLGHLCCSSLSYLQCKDYGIPVIPPVGINPVQGETIDYFSLGPLCRSNLSLEPSYIPSLTPSVLRLDRIDSDRWYYRDNIIFTLKVANLVDVR